MKIELPPSFISKQNLINLVHEYFVDEKLLPDTILETIKSASKFNLTESVKLVPKFNKEDVDSFFNHFEKTSSLLGWTNTAKILLLQSVLVGKGQIAYSSLNTEDSQSYDIIKNEVLKSYQLIPEAYRQKFRTCAKLDSETFSEFGKKLEINLDKWCHSMKVKND